MTTSLLHVRGKKVCMSMCRVLVPALTDLCLSILYPSQVHMQETKLCFFICQGPTRDEVIANLRNAFMKIADEYKIYTEEEKKKVIFNIKEIFKVLFVTVEYNIYKIIVIFIRSLQQVGFTL